MDLKKIIDELVYRKKALDIDSPAYKLINRILTGRHYRGSRSRLRRYLSSSCGITGDRAAASPAVPRQTKTQKSVACNPLAYPLLTAIDGGRPPTHVID
jgi:hypothetical protein